MHESDGWFLIVRVAGRLHGFAVAAVYEVLRVPELMGGFSASVPGLLGMAALRGELVPVLELADLLEIPAAPVEAKSRRLVRMELGGEAAGETARRVAFAVDEVLGVYRLGRGKLQAIALPGGVEQRWGAFDAGFARVLEGGGLLPEDAWEALAAAGAEVAA